MNTIINGIQNSIIYSIIYNTAMLKNMLRSLNTDMGKYLVSIILGLGLSSLFRKACNSRECIVFQAPSLDTLNETTYKYNNKCYNFKSSAVKCGSADKKVHFA